MISSNVLLLLRWQNDINSKEASEVTDRKFSRMRREGKQSKGIIGEEKRRVYSTKCIL